MDGCNLTRSGALFVVDLILLSVPPAWQYPNPAATRDRRHSSAPAACNVPCSLVTWVGDWRSHWWRPSPRSRCPVVATAAASARPFVLSWYDDVAEWGQKVYQLPELRTLQGFQSVTCKSYNLCVKSEGYFSDERLWLLTYVQMYVMYICHNWAILQDILSLFYVQCLYDNIWHQMKPLKALYFHCVISPGCHMSYDLCERTNMTNFYFI